MGAAFTADSGVRILIAMVLFAAAVLAGGLLAAHRPGAVGSSGYVSSPEADAGHLVLLGLMGAVFLPAGDHVSDRSWAWVFGVATAGFALVAARALRRPSGRAVAAGAGYHVLCALAMVYMFVAVSRTVTSTGVHRMSMSMSMAATSGGPGTLRLDWLGWLLVAVLIVDAVGVLTLVASSRVRAMAYAEVSGESAMVIESVGQVSAQERISAVPHVVMDLAMGAMLIAMLT